MESSKMRQMRVRSIFVTAFVLGAFAAPLRAQDTTGKKPGGLNKVARNVSSTVKKAGRDTKAEVHRDASKTHEALKDAGNDTKTATGNATGVHKVGGDVGKAAKAVSRTSKKTGARAKHGVKRVASAAHDSLSKAGKSAKEQVKKP
jgi:hypothetical protein